MGTIPNTGGRETILLVDDCIVVCKLIAIVLRRFGYLVIEASRASEAAEISQRYAGRIDLLIADVMLPDATGRDLGQQLIQARPESAVLCISVYAKDILGQDALPSGIGFLQKPFTIVALALHVREVLRK